MYSVLLLAIDTIQLIARFGNLVIWRSKLPLHVQTVWFHAPANEAPLITNKYNIISTIKYYNLPFARHQQLPSLPT